MVSCDQGDNGRKRQSFDKLQLWELNYVRANTTLFIGPQETFPSFILAWNYVANARIAQPVYLHFYISSYHGSYMETNGPGFILDHEGGGNMSIIGDNMNNITFTFTQAIGGYGFRVDSGHSFASISGIHVVGQSSVSNQKAFSADTEGSIQSLNNVIVDTMSYGLAAERGASIQCGNALTFNNVSGLVLFASKDAVIDAQYGIQSSSACYEGLYAEYNAAIYAEDVVISNCLNYGAYAFQGGVIDTENSRFSSCATGVYASYFGRVDIINGSITGSTNDDLVADYGSTIVASGSTYNTKSTDNDSYIYT